MLRTLKTSDIFKMSKILKKMNLKKEINIVNEDGETKTQSQVGVELVITAFENIHLAEDEVNEFLAELVGMKKEEFAELEIEKAFKIIEEFKSMPGIKNFLKRANQLTK